MIVATDVRYDEDRRLGFAAAVGFTDWSDPASVREWTVEVPNVAEYVPGSFYKRELPCLEQVLAPVTRDLTTVVVDGHVWLGEGRPGLGHYLYEALGRSIAVVGVAKSSFFGGYATEVLREGTTRPLYVTSVGLDPAEAAAHVRAMHGPYRLPTLLKRVDTLTRLPPA